MSTLYEDIVDFQIKQEGNTGDLADTTSRR